MPFCSNCGSSVGDGARFCAACGAPRLSQVNPQQAPFTPVPAQYINQQPPAIPPQYGYAAPQAAPSQYAYAPPPGPSQVVAILPQARKMKMMGLYDSYTIIFTPSQALVARLTNNVIKDVVNQSQARSKAEGKGWAGIVGDQMQAFGAAHTRYYQMTPQQILAETQGNFAIDNASVSLVKVKTGCEGGAKMVPLMITPKSNSRLQPENTSIA